MRADAKMPSSRVGGMPAVPPGGIVQRVLVQHMRTLNTARAAAAAAGVPMQRLPAGPLCCHCSRCGDMVSLAVVLVRNGGGDAGSCPAAGIASAQTGHSPSLMAPLQAAEASTRRGGSAGNQRTSSSALSGLSAAEAPPAAAETGAEQHQPLLLCLSCLVEAGFSSRDANLASGGHRSGSHGGPTGTVLFLHPDLERMEGLARQLEADPQAALHGEALHIYNRFCGFACTWLACWVHNRAAARAPLTSLPARHWSMVGRIVTFLCW